MNNLNLSDLTCEPIIAKKAQDANNIGVCQYSANQLLQSITPENMSTGLQRLFNVEKYEDSFLTSWQDDYNNWNKISEVITAMLRDNSRFNSNFSYNKDGIAKIGSVHYNSKYQQNREQDEEIDNNPLTDDGTYWARGIKDTDLLPQRFNMWDVSFNGTTITLSSTSEFSDYLFNAEQLKNGLELSFIPTQDGIGYGSGSSYTLTIDGISKKLFEDEDETKAILQTESNIRNGAMITIYYKTTGDGGNGAFYVKKDVKYYTPEQPLTATIDNTNRTITLSGRTPQANQWLSSLTSNDITTGFSLRIVMSGSNTGGAVPYTLIFNSNLSKQVIINYCNSNDNEPYCSQMLRDKVRYDITYRGALFVVDDYINVVQVKQGVSNGIHYEIKNDGICRQWQAASASTAGGSNITFPIAFSSNPDVQVTARSGQGTTATRSAWNRGSTATGFTIGQGESTECSWEASGEVDLSLL